jgi:RiboL-PSP-HEPN
MSRAELDIHFAKIDALIAEIEGFVPSTDFRSIQFRADLAGLLVVAMVATYETCVKEILYDYANKHHIAFGEFALRNFERLNSRIQVNDLKKYCGLFDPAIGRRFKAKLTLKKDDLMKRVGKNIVLSYEQVLDWRHDFAHAGIRQTTIEEATKTHRIAKRVMYIFDDAFNGP